MGSRLRIGASVFVCLVNVQCGSNPSPAITSSVGGATAFTGSGGAATQGSGGATASGVGGTPAMGGAVSAAGSQGAGGVAGPGSGGMFVGPGGGTSGAGNTGAGTGFAGAAGSAGGGGGASGGGGMGGCGARTGMRGKTTRTVTVSGMKRTYVAYLPQAGNASTPVPLVYVFHGATQTGQNMYDATEYAKLADKENIAVVFPDGQGTSSAAGTGNLAPWNVTDGPALCGLGAIVSNANPVDLPFVDAIRTDIAADQCIDAGHVFATGFSMGGYFSHHIACDRPDFKAAAPHSGATMADLSTCKTNHVPMIIFHGTSDPLIAPGCDDPNSPAQSGFPPSATLWAKKNGCQATYKTIMEPGTTMGNNGQCYLYDGCPADGQVELCTFTNLPHAWAGAPTCPGCIGSGAGFASATQLEWDFFKKYAW